MATTLSQAFTDFASRLEITDRQVGLISSAKSQVIAELGRQLNLENQPSLDIGSYDRNTMIKYLHEGDVDVMAIMQYQPNAGWYTGIGGPRNCIDYFCRALSSFHASPDRNCVTISYRDFRLDVVPAFRHNGGGFAIPDVTANAWLRSDRFDFQGLITQVNSNMDGAFVPLIKMLKGWNRQNGKPLNGFHLECLAYNHFRNYVRASNYEQMLDSFFELLYTRLFMSTHDPVTREKVDHYLDRGWPSPKHRALEVARKTAQDSKQALMYTYDAKTAISLWRDILGDFFPTYG